MFMDHYMENFKNIALNPSPLVFSLPFFRRCNNNWLRRKVEIENMWNSQYGMANKPQPYKDWTNIDIEPALAQIFQIRSAPFKKSSRKLAGPIGPDVIMNLWNFNILTQMNRSHECWQIVVLVLLVGNQYWVRKEKQRLHRRSFSSSKLQQKHIQAFRSVSKEDSLFEMWNKNIWKSPTESNSEFAGWANLKWELLVSSL